MEKILQIHTHIKVNVLFWILPLLLFFNQVYGEIVPGSVNGSTSVSLSGSSQYNLPISVPSGTAGMAPKLFLTYDSNAGSDLLGLGWSLSGLSTISRTNRTTFLDGRPAPIDFDNPEDGFNTDGLALDGVRLVPSPEDKSFFAKAIDDQTRVEKVSSNGNVYYIGRTKAGLKIYYGESKNSRIKTKEGKVYKWATSKIEDTFGNWIIIDYLNNNGDWGPSEIFYTLRDEQISNEYDVSELKTKAFASVKVEYSKDNTSITKQFLGGNTIEKSHFITSITSTFEKKEYRAYQFNYDKTERFGKRILREIKEIGADLGNGKPRLEFKPTVFEYTKVEPSWKEVKNYRLPSDFGTYSSLKSGYRFENLDSQGNKEIIYSAQLSGRHHSRVFKFDGKNWNIVPKLAPPVALGNNKTKTVPDVFIDLDNDDLLDLLVSTKVDGKLISKAFIQDANGWKEDDTFKIPFPISSDVEQLSVIKPFKTSSKNVLLNWNIKEKTLTLSHFDQKKWLSEKISGWKNEIDISKFHFGDYDCDGDKDIAIVSQSSKKITFVTPEFSDLSNPQLKKLAEFNFGGVLKNSISLSNQTCEKLTIQIDDDSTRSIGSLHIDKGSIKFVEIKSYDSNSVKIQDLVPLNLTANKKEYQDIAVVLKGLPKKNVATFSFDNNISSWVENSDHYYSPLTKDLNVDESYLVIGADADDKDGEDLLLLPIANAAPSAVLINDSKEFKFNTQKVPPIHFAQAKEVGGSPQFVDINGDGLVDLIGHHKDINNKTTLNTAQINLANGWKSITALKLPKPLTNEKGGKTGLFIDFNSDGISDFIYAYGADSSAWTMKFDKNGNAVGWIENSKFKLPDGETFSDPVNGDRGIRFFDVNADGRVDILIARREENGVFNAKTFLNEDGGWSNKAAEKKFNSPVPFVSRHKADVHYETKVFQGNYYRDLQILQIDLNSDGLLDLTFNYGQNNQTGFLQYEAQRHGCLNKVRVINKPTYCAGSYYNTGEGWRKASKDHYPPFQLDMSINNANFSYSNLDINGDGLSDLIPSMTQNGKNKYPVFLNTGNSWQADDNYKIPVSSLSSGKKKGSHRIIDLNGDGLLDIAFNRPDNKGVFFNTGSNWKKAKKEFAPPEQFASDKGEDLGIRIVDIDGNGLPDILKSWRDKSNKLFQSAYINTNSKKQSYKESRVDVLKSITSGMGIKTEFTYKSLLTPRISEKLKEDNFYSPSPVTSYPKISYIPTMYAVEKITETESDQSVHETIFQYKGFRLDLISGTPLGFEAQRSTTKVDDVVTSSESVLMYQDFFRNGFVKTKKRKVKNIDITSTNSIYKTISDYGNSWPKRVILESVNSKNKDLNGKELSLTEESYIYDKYNNLINVCMSYGNGSHTITKNTYDERPQLLNPKYWYMGRLLKAKVIHTMSEVNHPCKSIILEPTKLSETVVSNEVSFKYDIIINNKGAIDVKNSSGVINVEISNSDNDLALEKFYDYDKYGNKIRSTFSTKGENSRIHKFYFDNYGRFNIKRENALGHLSHEKYDGLLGLIFETTSANDISIQNEFDGFGRLIKTISPTGIESTQIRQLEDNLEINNRKVSYSISEKVADLPGKIDYFDFKGRMIKSVKVGLNDKKTISESKFDSRGRETETAITYFENEKPLFSKTEYDDLNRIIKTEVPDGGISTTSYDGLITKMTDANGSIAITKVNERGSILEVIDNAGGIIRHIYGPDERLLKTIQVDGLELKNEYDKAGNKITSIDPDLGIWNYKYNGFGELIWQRDAKGQITEIVYDELGRILTKIMQDNTEEYFYDENLYGLGRISRIQNMQGYSEKYKYNNFGKLKQKITLIDQEMYPVSFEYDKYNRVTDTFYPSNFRTKNEYDKWGFLSRVLSNNPIKPYTNGLSEQWRAIDRDQFGQVISEQLANGVVTETKYSKTKGSIEAIHIKKDKSRISDLHLEYDLVGNIIKKEEFVSKRKEKYKYDKLYRIKRWELNKKTKGKYKYDNAGRILFKSDIGRYKYNNAGMGHGVKEIRTLKGEKHKYSYDANGNTIFSPKGHFEYYSNNSVRSIYKSNNFWSKFKYSPDGNRYYQSFSQTKKIKDILAPFTTVTKINVGAYEKIIDHDDDFGVLPHGFIRHRLSVTSETGVIAILENSTQYDPLHGYAELKIKNGYKSKSIALNLFSQHYLHKDQLGSITHISDSKGKVVAAYNYDPWGLKTKNKNSVKVSKEFLNGSFKHGFTGHEHLDNLNLIHMNGRVYDPSIALFVTADPFIQYANNSQNYNRYSYVFNNPLRFIDPTGYFIKKFVKKAFKAIAKPFKAVGSFLEKNWKEIVVVAVAVTITVLSAGALGPIAAGMLAGAVSSGLHTSLYGGNLNDVLKSSIRGAVIGGVSAGFAHGIGSMGLDPVGAAFSHGTSQGLISEATGGDFGQGFLAGSFSSYAGSYMNGIDSEALQVITGAAVGGTAAVLGGGKFANGAITGAYVVAFNHLLHKLQNPTGGNIRGCDRHGCGHHGASRGSRSHRGIDITSEPNQFVTASVDGTIGNVGVVYANDPNFRYVEIIGKDGLHVRHMYTEPALGPVYNINKGAPISQGSIIGNSQSLLNKYPGITDHVHMEAFYLKGGNRQYINPTHFLQSQ